MYFVSSTSNLFSDMDHSEWSVSLIDASTGLRSEETYVTCLSILVLMKCYQIRSEITKRSEEVVNMRSLMYECVFLFSEYNNTDIKTRNLSFRS
ncbi:hypothetical protein AYI70_g390 [Smittium culicis]|uniref:Uncharacterized protein n=1 Tax=Smittium culicis TaxID=133412 RepID=A0A1R1YGY2_9FUNG|nr:hypothetical protein AYI70_g390 [Smittium culicis]